MEVTDVLKGRRFCLSGHGAWTKTSCSYSTAFSQPRKGHAWIPEMVLVRALQKRCTEPGVGDRCISDASETREVLDRILPFIVASNLWLRRVGIGLFVWRMWWMHDGKFRSSKRYPRYRSYGEVVLTTYGPSKLITFSLSSLSCLFLWRSPLDHRPINVASSAAVQSLMVVPVRL